MPQAARKAIAGLAIIILTTFPTLWALPVSATTVRPDYSSWKNSLTSPAQPGCFNVRYPSTVWRSVPCLTPPIRPLILTKPSSVGGGFAVGDGNDELASSGSTLIGSSTGAFPNVVGLTSETDSVTGGSDYYTLQINSQIFPTTTIYTGNVQASGWEQFVFSNDPFYGGFIFIQYWLIGYTPPCPSTNPPGGTAWMYFSGSGGAPGCYANSIGASVPFQPASNLGSLAYTGYANLNSKDEGLLCVSGTCYSFSTTDQVLDLYQNWKRSEFNVFGYGDGSQAAFNSGTSLTVTNALKDQSGNSITPSCLGGGYTAETNNLNLGSCSSSGNQIVFTENNGNFATLTTNTASGQGSVSPNCPSPVSCQQAVGSSVSVTATPSAGWQFSSWTVSGSSCSGGSAVNPCQFSMPSPAVTVSANFIQLTFTLITQVDAGSGSFSPNCPSPSGCSENAGSSVAVTGNPSPGWVFQTWSTQTGVACAANPCSFTMPSHPVTLGATFIQTTAITLTVSPQSVTVGSAVQLSGSITPNPGSVQVTISVSPNNASWTAIILLSTNSGGTYTTMWTPPYPGSFGLRASWNGNAGFQGSMSSPPQGLRVTGTLPTTSLLLVAPQAVSRGAVADLSVTVFNLAGSSLSTQITIQVLGPNGYVFFDTVNVQVAANSQTTILYDWTAPNQAGAYTVVAQTLPSQPGAYDSSTITVQ